MQTAQIRILMWKCARMQIIEIAIAQVAHIVLMSVQILTYADCPI